MKKNNALVLLFILAFNYLNAQEIVITTKKKASNEFTLGFKVVGKDDRTVQVDFGNGKLVSVNVPAGNKYTTITEILKSNTIKIYSKMIKSFLCNNEELTSLEIDASLSKTLAQIECSNNLLTTLNLELFPKLSYLKINNNLLNQLLINELAPMKAMFDISYNNLPNSVIDKILQRDKLIFSHQNENKSETTKVAAGSAKKQASKEIQKADQSLTPTKKIFNKDALNLIPIRPGKAGITPFWNEKAVQFLFPPSFNIKPHPQAVSYRFVIVSEQNDTVNFVANNPSESLYQIWSGLSVGRYKLDVIALGKNAESIGNIYSRYFHRAAEFQKNGEAPKISLEESVKMGLNALVHSPDLACWFSKSGVPDTTFIMYRYPSKMCGSAASALAIYASQTPAPADAAAALQAARNAADYLLSLSFVKGEKWEFHPRTYHPTMFQKMLARHKMNPDHYMTSYGGEVAQYYLDVFEATKDKKYLNAAINIGNTYLKNQLTNGTWPLMVYGTNGDLVTENMLIPTIVITYLQRIYNVTQNKQYLEAANKALIWVAENPVKTWNWQGQYEDVRPMPPYQNLTEHEACDFAIYLLENYPNDKQKVAIATDLIRFSEDQFVVWSNPPVDSPTVQNPDGKQAKSSKWITPCVLEQYRCYAPVSASSAKMIRAYCALYQLTKNSIDLEKANALATSMVNLQQTTKAGGRYLTWIQQNPGQKWLNCELTTIKAIRELINANKK